MKTMLLAQSIDDRMNQMVEHAVTLERNDMLMKKLIRLMANKMHTNADGDIVMSLNEDDAEFIKYVCDKCNVFNTIEEGDRE